MDSSVFLDSKSVIIHANAQGLFKALVAQVKRDFIRANIEINLEENIRPTELQSLVQENIYLLLMERFSVYLNLMYVVDIPEGVFKDLKITDAVDVAVQVTFLIFKRELEKVTLKEKYRSSN